MGLDRRHFLKHMAGLAALAGSASTFMQGLRAAAPDLKKQGKSLIILWMGGGPSHMDLWDLKPGQPTGGDFKPIKTAVSGIEISEVLPTVAQQFKNLSIIRSLQSNEGSHERGTTLMNTGRLPNPVVQYPHAGAIVGVPAGVEGSGPAGLHRHRRHRPAHRPGLPRHDQRSVHGPEPRPAAAEHQAARCPRHRRDAGGAHPPPAAPVLHGRGPFQPVAIPAPGEQGRTSEDEKKREASCANSVPPVRRMPMSTRKRST